jgi:formylglycine-generating enzyme required for sulfatase activity
MMPRNLFKNFRYRLITENEWEYIAGDVTNEISLDSFGSMGRFGIYDLNDGRSEWCIDDYIAYNEFTSVIKSNESSFVSNLNQSKVIRGNIDKKNITPLFFKNIPFLLHDGKNILV